MGLLDSIMGRPVSGAPAAAPANQPKLTPAAQKYLDRAVALSKGTGSISPEDSAELLALAKNLKPEDHLSMRKVNASKMVDKLTPMAKGNDERAEAAKSLLKVLKGGILPGIGENASVWIESGQPATREDVLKAKAAP
jgi:hypothetical protein